MRYADWQKRFWAAMDAQRKSAFVWGSNDCVLFAASMADAISDGGYVRRAKDSFAWTNAREAAALLSAGELQQQVEAVLGPLLPWPRLNMGDIALVLDDKARQSLSIHDGCQFIGKTENGVQSIPFHYVQGGWHVT